MEFAIVVLAMVCGIQSVGIAVSIPFLFWKLFRLESDLNRMDEVVANLMDLAGITPETKEK